MEMESIHRVWVCGGLLVLGLGFCMANIRRSVALGKGFSEHTIKMYVSFMVFTVLGVVAVSGAITGEAMAGIIGSAVGFALGNKLWEGAKDQ